MDTEIAVIVEAESRPLDGFMNTRLLFEQQEQRFSRFRETSLLSKLNRGDEIEDAWFAQAVALALAAHRETGGLFNPMVLPALRDAGYATTFSAVSGGAPRAQPVPSPAAALAVSNARVALVEGQLDLGGVVKGWTVDVAVEWLRQQHESVFVNAGGDLRCTGSEEGRGGWAVDIESPFGGSPWEGTITDAVATSSAMKRRWTTASGDAAHHLIDPRTGLPAASDYVQVTVRADACWRAEAWAKAVLIGGPAGLGLGEGLGLPIFAIRNDGTTDRSTRW